MYCTSHAVTALTSVDRSFLVLVVVVVFAFACRTTEIYRLMSRKAMASDGAASTALPAGQAVAVTAENTEKPAKQGGCCK